MKTPTRPTLPKAEDIPAPKRSQFEAFVKKLVSVPKAELDKREAEYKKTRKPKKT